MRGEAKCSFGNSMPLTDLFGEDRIFAGCFTLHRGITAVAMQQDMSSCLPTAGRLLCYRFPGQVQPQKGDKATEATTARLTDFSLAPYALGLTSNSPSSRNINPKPSLTASIFQHRCMLRLGKTPVIHESCTERITGYLQPLG